MKLYFDEFARKIVNAEIEIYNEASIQYELAIFLRSRLHEWNIQLERNIDYSKAYGSVRLAGDPASSTRTRSTSFGTLSSAAAAEAA